MPDFDALARVTCSEFLTATDLKEVCRRRAFAAPAGGGRAALDARLAPRLLRGWEPPMLLEPERIDLHRRPDQR
ncbi:MAG: hypothetical protein HYZ53_05585 [Planctomycetes bacterium]|nr:hypothetical protein [Planctomycetota bacterium]